MFLWFINFFWNSQEVPPKNFQIVITVILQQIPLGISPKDPSEIHWKIALNYQRNSQKNCGRIFHRNSQRNPREIPSGTPGGILKRNTRKILKKIPKELNFWFEEKFSCNLRGALRRTLANISIAVLPEELSEGFLGELTEKFPEKFPEELSEECTNKFYSNPHQKFQRASYSNTHTNLQTNFQKKIRSNTHYWLLLRGISKRRFEGEITKFATKK